MGYAKKLLLAKILVTFCMLNYSLVPLLIDFGPSHIASENWTPHGWFHLSWTLSYHLLALPVLLYVLWSKLHGTGRSVRLVALLGLAYTGSFYVALFLRGHLNSDLHDIGHEHLIFGFDGNSFVVTLNFVILVVATILSLKPRHN